MFWDEKVKTPTAKLPVEAVLYIVMQSNAPDDVRLVHTKEADGVQNDVVPELVGAVALVMALPPAE